MSGLELKDTRAGYVRTDVLRGVSVSVAPGTRVIVLGPNGAGKSTLLKVASGQLSLTSGSRVIDGQDATAWPAYRVARAGVRWVGEPRPVYPGMTVAENLMIGGFQNKDTIEQELERVYEMLPVLAERRKQAAGTLSGGQQQMLSIGQALMSRPTYLCLDEPSLGLAAAIVERVADFVVELAESGVGILWAEQFPEIAVPRADRVVLLGAGQVARDALPKDISREDIDSVYMGAT